MKKLKRYREIPYEMIINIFSYIPDNKNCVNFSLVNKYHREIFEFMLERSSTLMYRLKFLNGKRPKDYTFNVFSLRRLPNFKIDDRFYVTTIEDYEKGIKEVDIVQICAKINKKYGEVTMIAGGYALIHFLKDKNYDFHNKRVFEGYFDNFDDYFKEVNYPMCKKCSKLPEEEDRQKCMHNYIPPKFKYNFNKSNDIDIFILGKDKGTIAYEILNEFKKEFQKEFQIVSRNGCYDINLILHTERKHEGKRSEWEVEKPYFQLILKRDAITPNDIFSFFDLDICKIGYFPGLKKVVAPVDFFRAMSSGKNYSDFVFKCLSSKHKSRIYKYFFRTGIRTTLQCPPLMSYYHDHTTQKFCKKVIRWGKLKDDRKDNTYKCFGLIKLNIPHKNYYGYRFSSYECCFSSFDEIPPNFFKESKHKYYYECFGLRKDNDRFVYVKHTQKLMLNQKTLINYTP